jgi:predicted GNAT family acetyltransferase
VRVERCPDADRFVALAGPFLAAHEATHNLQLGLLSRLRVEPLLYGAEPFFAVALAGGEVAGTIMRTPPFGVILSRATSDAAVDALAHATAAAFAELPGAVGPTDVAARFAATWCALTGQTGRISMRQGVHCAARVTELPPAPGRMRRATPDERPLLVAWTRAFAEESLDPTLHPVDPEESVARRERDPDGAWLLWDDDGPVSLAGVGNRTPTGIRVGPVYTPPEQRRHGYATALVAALTREQLALGRRFCFLFTDLANPTSNAIYARIGYEPVADWDQWELVSSRRSA